MNNRCVDVHIFTNVTSEIPEYLKFNISESFKYFKWTIITLSNTAHAMAEQGHGGEGIGNDGRDNNAAVIEELRRRNPLLAEVLIKYPNYFLEWPEEALGLFIWRVWESLIGVNDVDRRRLEENIHMVINMRDAPKKLRNAAKIAKKLIEKEKKMLNII